MQRFDKTNIPLTRDTRKLKVICHISILKAIYTEQLQMSYLQGLIPIPHVMPKSNLKTVPHYKTSESRKHPPAPPNIFPKYQPNATHLPNQNSTHPTCCQIREGVLNQCNPTTLRQVQPLSANFLNNTIPKRFSLIRSSQRKTKILHSQGRHPASQDACQIFYIIDITNRDQFRFYQVNLQT